MLERWWVLGSEDIPLSAPLCVGVTPGYSFGAANTAACSGASASNSLRPRSRSAANTTGRTHCGCASWANRRASDHQRALLKNASARRPSDAQKIIKEAGGVYIAGGFNKAKVDHGGPAVGNRYVIIRYENEAAYNNFYNGGGKGG